MKTRILALCALIGLALGPGLAHAARGYTYVQAPAAAAAVFDMRSTQSLSYLITNTNTGGNAGERIYQMRFRINSGSLISSTTAAPAGWTRTAWSSTSVTFRANSWANAIAVGGSTSFTVVLTLRATTADVTERLRDMRAYYTTTTTGPPFTNLSSVTTNTPGSWTLKSLAITSFQITDTLGTPITSLAAGGSFRLVMTVKNNSSAAQNPITSIPNPPGSVETPAASVTQTLTGTAGSPLNLASLASGTITFTFSTAAGDNGTIYFTAIAQRIASVTSSSATSSTLAVLQCLSASFTVPPSASCKYVGSSSTLTMSITNNCVSALTTVTAALGALPGQVTLVSGPTPANYATIPVGATRTVDWVYQIKPASPLTAFAFSGTATSVVPAQTTPPISSPAITPGGFPTVVNPTATNASSTNVELTWTATNSGCANVNSVAITIPAGWVWANDAYSLVDLSALNSVETWVPTGANPVAFTSPNAPNQMPQSFAGDFSLVFSATPAVAGASNFTVNVTDANGVTVPVTVPVTVSPFKDPNGLNSATNKTWREQVP